VDVSVVTPVRDDPDLLRAMQSVPPGVEYIVVLTRAPGDVVRLVEDFRRDHRPDMIVRQLDMAGMSAGVNDGVRIASSEKIVILDSDCTLTAETLQAYSDALDRADFVRGTTHVRRAGLWSSFSGLGQEELNHVAAGGRCRLIGPSIAFRKTPFLALGGYDLRIGGSCDHEFVLRLEDAGVVTAFEPKAVVWHTAITLRIDLRAHLGYGRGMRAIDRKRGGRYGLGVCLDRWAPATLWRKLVQRGPASLLRSLLLGGVMIVGYVQGQRRPPAGVV
jgi:GT2 family glycosyltransferase